MSLRAVDSISLEAVSKVWLQDQLQVIQFLGQVMWDKLLATYVPPTCARNDMGSIDRCYHCLSGGDQKLRHAAGDQAACSGPGRLTAINQCFSVSTVCVLVESQEKVRELYTAQSATLSRGSGINNSVSCISGQGAFCGPYSKLHVIHSHCVRSCFQATANLTVIREF